MEDSLIIGTTAVDTVRIYAASTTGLVEEARRIHQTWATASAALGRVLTGTIILGVMADNLRRLTVEVCGDGPLGKLMAVSNQRGTVKGYLDNPQVDLDLNSMGKFDVGKAVGKGELVVTKELGIGEPYQGIVPLQTGEIAEDFAYYFTKSEQTPSAVILGVLVNPDGSIREAGGIIIQLMPGADEATTVALEEKLERMPTLTRLLDEGMTPHKLASQFACGPDGLKVLDTVTLRYQCDCSHDKFLGPLLSIGRQELQPLFQEEKEIEVRCHFCNQTYYYTADQLKLLDEPGPQNAV